ncbi:PadR family transcriptional regulator [Alkalihalobacillus pseudalcaliphilus]|uniref:PadR family transcriptional regulator n=1 Tax=Alkalihalobacillus pseudalcaliphilus TaxID=79884 RepID=UPI00064DE626|nr:PadR family transcriptional regulator [Alkalihalobacillus pseudalcaliphilus]KMK77525.1 hypothetical protein AB990_03390 [Alkalihalobacillus pseudalcaliphilus]
MSTRLTVLGLLSQKSMTGYEIQQVLQQSGADRWAGILSGSVYHALKKLEKDQFIEVQSVENNGNRQKAIYRLTVKGTAELEQLIIESLEKSSVSYPTTLYASLTFLDLINEDHALRALNNHRDRLRSEIEYMEVGRKKKEAIIDMAPHIQMLFSNINKQLLLQIELIEQIIDFLEKKKEK